jgi:hypothetical protein
LPFPKFSSRFYAWWYFSIAAGFALLALHKALTAERLWLIGIRVLIAVEFAALDLRNCAAIFRISEWNRHSCLFA